MIKGEVFRTNSHGDVEIVEYINSVKVLVRFVGSGFETYARAGDIRNGRVKDKTMPTVCGVGFVGVGNFSPTANGKATKEYSVWKTMLQRCYDDKRLKKYPFYDGCTVCDEWHNFQNFAEWYTSNYPAGGGDYDIDKDMLSSGDKLYSPSTCKFVSSAENVSFSKRGVFFVLSPCGNVKKIENMKAFCEQNHLHPSAMSAVASGKSGYHKGFRPLTPEQKKEFGL